MPNQESLPTTETKMKKCWTFQRLQFKSLWKYAKCQNMPSKLMKKMDWLSGVWTGPYEPVVQGTSILSSTHKLISRLVLILNKKCWICRCRGLYTDIDASIQFQQFGSITDVWVHVRNAVHGDQDSMDIEVIEDTEKAEIEANDFSKNLVRTKQLTWYFCKTKLLRTKMINKSTTNALFTL